jgi:hypothetical protein
MAVRLASGLAALGGGVQGAALNVGALTSDTFEEPSGLQGRLASAAAWIFCST